MTLRNTLYNMFDSSFIMILFSFSTALAFDLLAGGGVADETATLGVRDDCAGRRTSSDNVGIRDCDAFSELLLFCCCAGG